MEVEGVFDEYKRIKNLDPARLKPFKDAHHPGDVIRIIFDDSIESSTSAAFRKFHVVRDEYAVKAGHTKEYAKILLKYRHGITIPYVPGEPPPAWGQTIYEMFGELLYFKSTLKYNHDELSVLIEGALGDISETT